MYLYETIEIAEVAAEPILRAVLRKVEPIPAGVRKVEVWCSDMKDPGDDFTEFRFVDGRGRCLVTRREAGY